MIVWKVHIGDDEFRIVILDCGDELSSFTIGKIVNEIIFLVIKNYDTR